MATGPQEAPNNLISNTFLNILDLLGEGPIGGFVINSGAYGNDPLTSIYYDNVPVRNLDGSYNFNVSGQGFQIGFALGTTGQTPMNGFDKVENIVPLSSNTQLANPPNGLGTVKTVTASFNTSMYPDADSMRVTIRIPSLYTVDNQGNTNGFNVSYAIDISLNNGPFVQYDEITVQGKCTSPYLYSSSYILPKTTPAASSYQWTVRVRKTDQDVLLINTSNSIYVDSISVISSSTFTYTNSAVVGTFITADQFSQIPNRAYLMNGLLINVPVGYTPTQYNPLVPASYPNIWYGQFQTGIWTDNPAWIFYDILTNTRYGLGDFIQAELVDKWSIYQIAQYCDQLVDNGQGNGGVEPRFSCNINLQQPDDAYNVLLNLSSVFRGMIYYANGAITATQQDNKAAVAEYTNANVVNGQFNYADSARNTRSTVAQVRWNDPSNLYRQNTAYVEDTEGILRYGYVLKDAAAIGCTSPGQAYRLGQWLLLAERTLTETINFQVGLEGIFTRPGDVFYVYDNFRNNQNQGGRITGISPDYKTLYLDRTVLIQSGYNYNMTAAVPNLTLEGSGAITGSNQINLIRNSQIETRAVTNTYTNVPTDTINLLTPFSTGLFVGSPWILSVTGGGTPLNNASIYQCLSTAEIQPGIIEIVGLQYNTGLLTLVEQNYNIVANPPNSGDNSPIDPPTDLLITGVTGLFNNNIFYYYISLNWSPTDSPNLAYYVVSGQQFGGGYANIGNPTSTSAFLNTETTGIQRFMVAAVSRGGVYSTFITGSYTIAASNPMGTPPLSGVVISDEYDATYIAIDRKFTGYLGTTPTFSWTIPVDVNGITIPNYIYTSGYRLSIKSYDDSVTYFQTEVPTSDDLSYKIPSTELNTIGQRGFDFVVEPKDVFGNYVNGAKLKVNHPYPRPPAGSGFIGFNGGILYAITPNPLDQDISGVAIWSSNVTGFVPTWSNYIYLSPDMSAIALNNITTEYNTWFAIVDKWGTSGAPIYGPVAMSPNDSISGFIIQLNADLAAAYHTISGVFSQLTGIITQQISIVSGQNQLTASSLFGLSGQITGQSIINTALLAQMNTITVGASGVLVQQVNALQASLQTTGQNLTALIGTVATAVVTTSGALANQINIVQANTSGVSGVLSARIAVDETALTNSGAALSNRITQVYAGVAFGSGFTTAQVTNVNSAIASTGGALSQWLTQLSSTTTGANASVNIAASAFVTGGSNGLGGVAIASWGFQLDANNKVVSMRATAASAGTVPGGIGTIVFGGADLQSDGFSAGSAGWRIRPNGDSEFNNGIFRGTLDANGGNFVIDGNGLSASVNTAGRVTIPSNQSNSAIIRFYGNTSNPPDIEMGTYLLGGIWTPVIDVGGGSFISALGVNTPTVNTTTVSCLRSSSQVVTIGGGSTEEAVNLDLSSYGWSTKANMGLIQVASDNQYKARYDYDDGGNSSTNAVVKISRFDGGTNGNVTIRLSVLFGQ